jgi:hypothetical protein
MPAVMADWEAFASRIDELPEEELLERSADELLKRLESIGQRTSSLADSAPAAMQRRLSEASSAGDGGSSVCSLSTDGGSHSSRGGRPPRLRRETRRSSTGKENGGAAARHVPQISSRSKDLVGEREGDVGERLHEAGLQAAARRQHAAAEASRLADEKLTQEAREAVPEINGVSSMLAAGREGHVSDRLFVHAKETARAKAEKALEVRRSEAAAAIPTVSGGSERIAAVLPGREGPVQVRAPPTHTNAKPWRRDARTTSPRRARTPSMPRR